MAGGKDSGTAEGLKTIVFGKAFSLLRDKKVRLVADTKRAWHFEVEGTRETHDVMIRQDGGIKLICTCEFSSIKPEMLCSHKVACLMYIFQNYCSGVKIRDDILSGLEYYKDPGESWETFVNSVLEEWLIEKKTKK